MGRSNARAGNGRVFSASSQGVKKARSRGGASGSAPGAARPLKTSAVDIDDTYTFDEKLPKRHRTSAQQLSLTREEAEPDRRRTGEDEDEDMAARIRKVAMMIAGDDGGDVESDDDEDLDSDEAWEEDGSDEERWGDVFRDLKKSKGKKGKDVVLKPAKPLNVNLDESEPESDPEIERSPRTAFKSAFPDEEEDGEDEEDEEMESGDEDEDEDDEDEDEDDEDEDDDEMFDEDPDLPSDLSDEEDDGLDGLDAFVDQLAGKDKKRKAEEDGAEPGKKRRVLPVVSAPGLSNGSDLALRSKNKVDLASLIASNPSLASASSLLPSKSDKKSTSVLKSGVLSAPLPTVVQDRIDREAAYEKTKEEGQKWSGLMKRVKEAEHLSFPLQAKARGGVKGAGEVIATFKPENEHESAVHALLAKANLTDAGVKAAEDEALRGQDLSPEEIEARRAELRYQRELMFRAEQKAKRVSKIKSKTFRKLARKRAAKAAAADGNQGLSLEDLERIDPEAAEEERERLERERARERATLRHGARSSRWARDVGGDADETDDRRRAKAEMMDIRDRLQRKIHGRDSGESESDDSESGGEDDDEEAIKTRAFDQLAALDAKAAKDAAAPKAKGLMQMKFMQNAEKRKLQGVADEEDALRRDIEMFGNDEGEAGDDESGDEGEAAVLKLGEGRMVFSGTAPATSQKEAPSVSKGGPAAKSQPRQPSLSPEPSTAGAFGDVNPWLAAASAAGPSRKSNKVATSSEAKAVRALKKAARGRDDDDDDSVEISMDVGKPAAREAAAPKGKDKAAAEPKAAAKTAAKPVPAAETNGDDAGADADSDSDSSSSDSDDELLPASGVKAFKQRALVAEAFAGDDVVADFTAEKAAIEAADAPQTVDTSLPGWGSWGGKGAKKRKTPSKYIKTSAGVASEKRRDAGRANVIISEKKDKKASRFLPTDLPYPYTSVAQYEASFANPVGGEWNSRAGFQRQTLPRVTKKPGAIIEPVRRLF